VYQKNVETNEGRDFSETFSQVFKKFPSEYLVVLLAIWAGGKAQIWVFWI